MNYKEIATAIILEVAYKLECFEVERSGYTAQDRDDFYFDNVDADALAYEVRGRA